jgi:hypothetical protein
MELEQRIKTLEYEMKVLKNEIQRTLLEIQEQILAHYYPELRSEEIKAPEAARQTPPLPRPASENGKGATLAVPPSSTANEAHSSKPAPSAPVVRKITLDQVRGASGDVEPADGISRMSKLLDWALDGAAQIGLERIKALIETLAARKVIAPEIREMLLRIAPLNRRAPPETVGVREMIQVIMQLDTILERPADIEEALALIEEARIG